jgi:hypothetical protein
VSSASSSAPELPAVVSGCLGDLEAANQVAVDAQLVLLADYKNGDLGAASRMGLSLGGRWLAAAF